MVSSPFSCFTGTHTNWFPFMSSITSPLFHPFGVSPSHFAASVFTALNPTGTTGFRYDLSAPFTVWFPGPVFMFPIPRLPSPVSSSCSLVVTYSTVLYPMLSLTYSWLYPVLFPAGSSCSYVPPLTTICPSLFSFVISPTFPARSYMFLAFQFSSFPVWAFVPL